MAFSVPLLDRAAVLLATAAFAASAAAASAQSPPVAMVEDFDRGEISPALWAVREGARSTMELVDLDGDGSDYALLMHPGNPTEFWSSAVRSRVQFSRSAGSRMTATIWGAEGLASGDYSHPDGIGWTLGFFRSGDPGLQPFTQYEAALDDWHYPAAGNNNLRFTQHPADSVFAGGSGGPALGPVFRNFLLNAVDKQSAVTVRITLGTQSGAMLEWRPANSANFVTAIDTRNQSGGTQDLVWLGFAPVGAPVFIDDILVEGEAVFTEDWQSGAIAPHHWIAAAGQGAITEVVSTGGGNQAVVMWPGPGNPALSTLRTTLGFRRGPGGVTAEATLWGDTTRGDAPNIYPNGAGFNLGFRYRGVNSVLAFEDIEAGIDHWLTEEFNNDRLLFKQSDSKSAFLGGPLAPQLPAAFTTAIRNATSKETGVRVRITLGEQDGARFQWFDPQFGVFRTEFDNRDRGTGGASPVATFAFGPTAASIHVDDIVIRGPVEQWPPASAEEIPRFEFENDPGMAWRLSRFLAHFYYNRSIRDGADALFNEEYIAVADYWKGGLRDLLQNNSLHAMHRAKILSMGVQPDGYINTNQHFSHSHEWGWPFPLWVQATGVRGTRAAGWHFQDRPIGWVGDFLISWGDTRWYTAAARNNWTLNGLQDQGIVQDRWRLQTTSGDAWLQTPLGVTFDRTNTPFLQLRWLRSGTPPPGQKPYIEWRRLGDTGYSPDRRIYFENNGNPAYEAISGVRHALIPVKDHPLWNGTITRIRIHPAPGETGVQVEIDSFFSAYDTRHTVNMPYYIITAWEYFRWTGDTAFLRQRIGQMRTSLRYQQDELGGLANNHIRTPWPNNDGRSGIVYVNGQKQLRSGVGKGTNYWDLLPFGYDDMYATSLYYKTTEIMAELEEAIAANPQWNIPGDGTPFDPASLRSHAEQVRQTANDYFWNDETGRFIAVQDIEGTRWDYGFTFVNLEAIWHGIANEDRAQSIMDWITGERIVAGDTSQGADIYRWRFGPRATTKRNIDWYVWAWSAPESIPFGGQVQDGGAVLGFTFYDLWARLRILGPDNAWDRLREIMEWEADVWALGGYRQFYEVNEGTMQGGGPPGGLGIDFEFFESSMVPAIIPRGFLGMEPSATTLRIDPNPPSQSPRLVVRNASYRGNVFDIAGERDRVELDFRSAPTPAIQIELPGEWQREGSGESGSLFSIGAAGTHAFTRSGTGLPTAWELY